MPRKKKPHVQPISTHEIALDGETYAIEVWGSYADEGQRGSHRRKLKAKVFDVAIQRLSDQYYFSNSPTERQITKRRLYDKRFNSELVSEIKKICRANKIQAGRSVLYDVARDIKITIRALDNALAEKRRSEAKDAKQADETTSTEIPNCKNSP